MVRAPSGVEITQPGPVVVIGPNGSGKTRLARGLTSDRTIDVINALRNTRVTPQLQAMAMTAARQNFRNQLDQVRSQPYEISSDFDFMLVTLLAESYSAAFEHLQSARSNPHEALPPRTALEQIQEIWGDFFPGRELFFRDYTPMIKNANNEAGVPAEYSAWQMSDGEKAALYLAGRILGSEPGRVILVDEPETHLHSLLAADLWDALEDKRPDLRLVYVTHDMHFAASRRGAHHLLANPHTGLTAIDLTDNIPDDLAALLLGSASLSFSASRIIFCEGDETSYDRRLYSAAARGSGTVVRAVGSYDRVLRCVTALRDSKIVANLDVMGLIDRDYHPDAFIDSLAGGIHILGVHEVETLFALPEVVKCVAAHGKVDFDPARYAQSLMGQFDETDRRHVVVERWKRRVESGFTSATAGFRGRDSSLEDLAQSLPGALDPSAWELTPQAILEEEATRVEKSLQSEATVRECMRLMPGKKLIAFAAHQAGMTAVAYVGLIVSTLREDSADPGRDDRRTLREQLVEALKPELPSALFE